MDSTAVVACERGVPELAKGFKKFMHFILITKLASANPTVSVITHLACHLRAASVLFCECLAARTVANDGRALATNPLAERI